MGQSGIWFGLGTVVDAVVGQIFQFTVVVNHSELCPGSDLHVAFAKSLRHMGASIDTTAIAKFIPKNGDDSHRSGCISSFRISESLSVFCRAELLAIDRFSTAEVLAAMPVVVTLAVDHDLFILELVARQRMGVISRLHPGGQACSLDKQALFGTFC